MMQSSDNDKKQKTNAKRNQPEDAKKPISSTQEEKPKVKLFKAIKVKDKVFLITKID